MNTQKIKNLIKTVLAIAYFPLLVPTTIRKINEQKEKLKEISETFLWTEKFLIGPKIRGLNINFNTSQIKEEIIALAKAIQKNPPKIILEIGTATGGTLFMFARTATIDAKIISIDLPLGRYGAGYFKYRIPLLRAFATAQQKIHLIRRDSHQTETIKMLEELLQGRKIDFLFIDGDHSYQGVKKDFENYLPFVSSNGLIAFHDIVPNDLDKSIGAPIFWQEIKNKYPSQEFIRSNADNTGCGIGIIRKLNK